MTDNNVQPMKESEACNGVGWALIVIGVIAGIAFIINFGQIEIPSPSYFNPNDTEKVWSGIMIITGIGIMFNGFIVGYLFQKVASILEYHENKLN